jgi:uncharacterized protein
VQKVLVDTGALVAVLDPTDRHHASCVAVLRRVQVPLVTVWPVVTEVSHLLSFSHAAQDALLELIDDGTIAVEALTRADVPRLRELSKKYTDLPMDLANAALVCVAERLKLRTIFTTDRRDFAVYRAKKNLKFRVLPEASA